MLFEIFSAVAIISISLLIYLGYSGLFHRVIVKVGLLPANSGLFFYKFYQQDYKNSGAAFRELEKFPIINKTCIGIYYDKPGEMPPEKLRSAIGIFLPDDDNASREELKETMSNVGFSNIHLPKINKAVIVEFPHRTMFSILIAVYRVYPRIIGYIMENKLHAGPALEYYIDSKIYFVFPLEDNDKFFVKECKKN